MKHIICEQGSTDWLRARLGIPTASNFHKIYLPNERRLPEMDDEQRKLYAKLKRKLERDAALAEVFGGKIPEVNHLSAQSRGYAFWLAAERLLGRPMESFDGTEWMIRGKDMEPKAVRMYEFEQEVETVTCGFLTTDDGRIGASPDRLVLHHAASVEIKCPSPAVHLEYLLDGFGADYIAQAQGQILVGELDWCDRYSFHEEMPPRVVRTDRDDGFIDQLRAALDQFCDMVDDLERRGRATGYFAEKFETAVDVMAKERRDAAGNPLTLADA